MMDSMSAVMQQQMLMNSNSSAFGDNSNNNGMNASIAKMDDSAFLESLQRAKDSGNGLIMDSVRSFSAMQPLQLQQGMVGSMQNNNMLGINSANNAGMPTRPAAGNGRAWAA